ncbi:MAG: hypothetical protein JNL62_17555 [Bryobacterales bacterium]|nr:hypothetical protein [Bryobacterales bacterium]
MKKWEYMVVRVSKNYHYVTDEANGQRELGPHPVIRPMLDKAGEDGWELIQVVGSLEELIFKRPKP